ncbi:MAG TPA: aminoglycoside adenylyltransferase domain-containing protein [Candidatus Dormibacteraeota bacterium]|nr:aminoglycoside adenylyltransferase domain-containing protein [Candidatus Dormibacteraeota bacterium]
MRIPPEVNGIFGELVARLRALLKERLVAVYLFGSATIGAYEPGVSDIDVVAVLDGDPTDEDVSALRAMHEQLAGDAPSWNDRIEVDYLSARALAEFRGEPRPAARISPGEPFHRIQIDRRWVLDWYQVQTSGVTLFGPPPAELIPAIGQAEFVTAVRDHLREWPEWVSGESDPGRIAHAVFTFCRSLRACTLGDFVSKKEAAIWAADELPDFRAVIEDALAWRYPPEPGTRRAPTGEGALGLCQAVVRLCSAA